MTTADRSGTAGRTPVRRDAIDINDFVYGATGARIRRLTMPDGKHWFPAVDVCGQLGYANSRKALSDHVPERSRAFLETVTGRYGLSVPPGREWRRDLQLIDLQGLIHLINGSTKPSCRPFKQWAVDVIATVQRDGCYDVGGPPADPGPPGAETPAGHGVPDRVADAIVRLEERNIRLDEQFAAAQCESLATQREALLAQRATAHALERIADRLDTLFASPAPTIPTQVSVPPQPARPTAQALLDDWKSRMSVTEDVWSVAVAIAPALAAEGELRQSLESIAERTGLSAHRVNECLRFMRRHACIRSLGGTADGAPHYALHRP
ncbi:Bro-N domain-containing protein [Streptomyces sp. BE147]|uniref:BRO-N domain-containing protein n=1 Tax=Streptomyces sp. BE147 TaxID=3002524 RepID=UPI002E775ADB|nr:Bro-N domain-containing protein [Streptomyces sp. BE147]MEE1739922.1 Bro-N domain-containing protein [Streptomyces sp. BE147]